MVLKALIFHISFQDSNDIFLKVAQRQTNCQCQWWTEGVECDSIIDIIVSIMWQLSQMSHHQTSAFLVTPAFIIEPMIIIMLITKCQYPVCASWKGENKEPKNKDACDAFHGLLSSSYLTSWASIDSSQGHLQDKKWFTTHVFVETFAFK